MINVRRILAGGALLTTLLAATSAFSQQEKTQINPSVESIPTGAKIFIAPFPDGFEMYLAAGILKKKVPVVVVNDRSQADFEISGSQGTVGGWARGYRERANIQIVNLKTGEAVLSYYCQVSQKQGKQGLGEYCTKYLKEKIRAE